MSPRQEPDLMPFPAHGIKRWAFGLLWGPDFYECSELKTCDRKGLLSVEPYEGNIRIFSVRLFANRLVKASSSIAEKIRCKDFTFTASG